MKLSLCLSLLVLSADVLAATNYFIPNSYRNRRDGNVFSSIGWSDRREATLEVDMDNEKIKELGVETSDQDTAAVSGKVFHRFANNLNLEVLLQSLKGKADITGNQETESDSMPYILGAGYEIPESAMAFGATLGNAVLKSKNKTTGAKSEFTMNTATVGWGKRLEDNLFLGVGYMNMNTKSKPFPSDTTHIYSLGGGKVWGDLKKPEAAAEAMLTYRNDHKIQSTGLIAQGLMNMDAFQYYALVSLSSSEDNNAGGEASSSANLRIGLDYEFSQFYVGPQIDFETSESKDVAESDDTATLLSLEGGYRTERFEVFARLGKTTENREYPAASTSNDEKLTGNDITVGASYFF